MSSQEKHVQRILLLEDDEDLAEGIELSLQSDEIKLTLCSSIAEAERKNVSLKCITHPKPWE